MKRKNLKNLTDEEEELYRFLRLARIKLENLGYKVYFTGDKYIFNESNKQVKENELLIAIKEQEKMNLKNNLNEKEINLLEKAGICVEDRNYNKKE